jgi:DNA-binding transcriptional ArsR family regulator
MLNRKPEMSAGEIAGEFHISAPSMSHHFGVLKEADLISARREGQQILYSLNTTVVQDLMTMLLEIFAGEEKQSRGDHDH